MSIADFSGRVRPDACPGALQVHEAADGPLARVRLPGGAVSAAQLRELAACATDLGSGVIELTSRANVQVRGLRSATAFAERMAFVGLLPSAAHERVRNIVASPLSGRGPAGLLDTQPLVEALDQALCACLRLAGLPGRFLLALDDGSGDVVGLGADVTFVGGTGRLLLAGRDSGLSLRGEAAVSYMIAAAEAFLDERESASALDTEVRQESASVRDGEAQRDRTAWRIGELEDGAARIAARLGGVAVDSPPFAPETRGAGLTEQRDGRVALEAVVPLGRLTAAQARAIAAAAESGVAVRLTPWRTVVLLDLPPSHADHVARALDAAGLVTDPASPWVGVTACTGRPGCAKALADVREDARRWVADRDGPTAMPVHWAGCERRCGLPRGPVIQMVATADGYVAATDGHVTTTD
ncbi:precorrin-3B synthase [Nonomuraea sp. NPDC049141]|uniref:precorrin-3B synthase n=1 Tax=Nonomuraea sp. NPDC049141 TaxID=3155500 RepID=UPI0033F1984F